MPRDVNHATLFGLAAQGAALSPCQVTDLGHDSLDPSLVCLSCPFVFPLGILCNACLVLFLIHCCPPEKPQETRPRRQSHVSTQPSPSHTKEKVISACAAATGDCWWFSARAGYPPGPLGLGSSCFLYGWGVGVSVTCLV